MVVCGSTLDSAQRTGRLDPSLSAAVSCVAPYSIGITSIGEVIEHFVLKGEQCILIGTAEITGLEEFARPSVASNTTECTAEDIANMKEGSLEDIALERKIASQRFSKQYFLVDLTRAEEKPGEIASAAEKWRDSGLRREKARDAYGIRVDRRHSVEGSTRTGARCPIFAHLAEGAVIYGRRCRPSAEFPKASLTVENVVTKEVKKDHDLQQFEVDGKIEFPADGRYRVRAFAGRSGELLWVLRDLSYCAKV
jgi:hypothetical protein